MNKILRLSLILVVLLAVLVGLGLAGASWWIMRQMGPEVWVARLEKQFNCRAEIADAKLSLLSRPALLSFESVKIAPRDAEVNKPLADRTPLADGAAPIVIAELVLKVKLDDLLNRRLLIDTLFIREPVLTETQNEQGRSSFETLFRQPGDQPEVLQSVPNATPTTTPPPVKTASGLEFAVQNAVIEHGRLTIHRKTTTVEISHLDFSLTEIDVNPSAPAQHNRMMAKLKASIQVHGQARIGGVKRPTKMADLQITGESDMVPLNPATGRWQPTSLLKLTLAQGSQLGGHITMGDAAGKEMKKLQEYGVDLAPVQVGGPLLEPAVVEGLFQNNQFSLRSDTRLAFSEYEVVIERGSWFNGAQDLHEMELSLACGAGLQTRLYAGIAKAELGESLSRGIIKALSDERGRMTFEIESEGPMSDPRIKPKLDRVLKNLMQGEGLGDILKGLLKKL